METIVARTLQQSYPQSNQHCEETTLGNNDDHEQDLCKRATAWTPPANDVEHDRYTLDAGPTEPRENPTKRGRGGVGVHPDLRPATHSFEDGGANKQAMPTLNGCNPLKLPNFGAGQAITRAQGHLDTTRRDARIAETARASKTRLQ